MNACSFLFFPGSESPEAVRKLLALSNKVRPHNPKQHHPPTPLTSPITPRRPTSPRQTRSVPVLLSHESSSVNSMSNLTRKPSRTGKIGCTTHSKSTTSVFLFLLPPAMHKLSDAKNLCWLTAYYYC